MTLIPTHSKKDMIINSLNEDNKELSNQLHSLRLAVCDYFNNSSPELSNAIMLGAPFPNEARGGIKLALSANIHFENGQWKMKEGK